MTLFIIYINSKGIPHTILFLSTAIHFFMTHREVYNFVDPPPSASDP